MHDRHTFDIDIRDIDFLCEVFYGRILIHMLPFFYLSVFKVLRRSRSEKNIPISCL